MGIGNVKGSSEYFGTFKGSCVNDRKCMENVKSNSCSQMITQHYVLNNEQEPEECDATKADSSNTVGFIIKRKQSLVKLTTKKR